jgi:hypothetical protein
MTDTGTGDGAGVITPPKTWPEFWWRLLPDARGWCAGAVFALTVGVLNMIDRQPMLLENASFMQLVGSIAGAGGLGLVLAFHFGSSSGTAKANERADKAAARLDAVTPPPVDGKP